MPTQPYTGAEIDESRLLLDVMKALDDGDESDEEIADVLLVAAAEPLQRRLLQDIGPKRLSLQRLHREAAARGRTDEDASVTVYIKFGFRLEWLPHVVCLPSSRRMAATFLRQMRLCCCFSDAIAAQIRCAR